MVDDDVTPEDAELLRGIMAEDDPRQLVARIHEFYRDGDRANRTPRAMLYLHLGFLSGTIMRILEEP